MRLELVKRPQRSALFSALSPFIAFVLTIIAGAIMFALLGVNPLVAFNIYFVEPVSQVWQLHELAIKAAPLILIALKGQSQIPVNEKLVLDITPVDLVAGTMLAVAAEANKAADTRPAPAPRRMNLAIVRAVPALYERAVRDGGPSQPLASA